MAIYSRKEKITKRVIFFVPSPCPMVELDKAVSAACLELARIKGVDQSELYDNEVMVQAWDDEIHVYYEIEVKE